MAQHLVYSVILATVISSVKMQTKNANSVDKMLLKLSKFQITTL